MDDSTLRKILKQGFNETPSPAPGEYARILARTRVAQQMRRRDRIGIPLSVAAASISLILVIHSALPSSRIEITRDVFISPFIFPVKDPSLEPLEYLLSSVVDSAK